MGYNILSIGRRKRLVKSNYLNSLSLLSLRLIA